MNYPAFYYGIVESVNPDYSITFRIPEILDNLSEYPTASPLVGHTTEILPGHYVFILQPNLLQDYFYFQLDQSSFTGLKFGNCIIDISDGETITNKIVTLDSDGNVDKVLTESTMSKSSYVVTSNDSNGNKKSRISMNNNTISIEVGGIKQVIDASDGITTTASATKLGKGTAGKLTIDGVPTPTGSGPLCAIPFCALTGAPHSGSVAQSNTGIKLE